MIGKRWIVGLVASLVLVASGRADVFNMGGTRNPDMGLIGAWCRRRRKLHPYREAES